MLRLLMLLQVPAVLWGQCMPDEERRDCFTWPGASQAACEERGCTWCASAQEGYPWCYYNDHVCPSEIPEASRVECVPAAPNRQACINQGCIWCESAVPNTPWCFTDSSVSLGGAFCPPDATENDRLDCHPEPGANLQTCLQRGCHWCESSGTDVPWCFQPKRQGYRMVGQEIETEKGYQVNLARIQTPSWFGGEIDDVRMDVEFHTLDRIRVKIYDPNNERFEVPLHIESPDKALVRKYRIEFFNDPVFSFKITRIATGAVIFDTSIGGLQFADQFIQVASYTEQAVYGLGEHETPNFRHNMQYKVWPMWARDHAVAPTNLYGVQPFYMSIENGNEAHGVLFLNSNAQELELLPNPGVAFRSIGGIFDMYIFMGPDPDQVIQQYQQAIGMPVMVPYWALGYQLCRWGYTDLDHMKQAVERTRLYNIPHDVQYGDIDYMDDARDFTIDPVNFAGLPDYVNELQAQGTRFVIILDPAIYISDTPGEYPTFDRGQEQQVWAMDGSNPAEGEVWPGPVYFPDYSKASTQDWWTEEIRIFLQQMNFTGLWIDMNEPANFIDGRVGGCPDDPLNNPPFIPEIADRSVWRSTICMGIQQEFGLHYNVHSLYGWSMSKQTFHSARDVFDGKRSVVFSRSTFPGSGAYAQHWLGDNWSLWSNLRASIVGMFNFNMFGYPFVGPDICGFIGTATEELCLRWHQLGAFYPFSRAHNARGEPDQDPGMWPSVGNAAREALLIRYTLLPYMYTLFYHSTTTGATVIRPLWFEFVNDVQTHNIQDTFLWGGGLLVAPVLDQGVDAVQVYFPDARWYSYYDGSEVPVRGNTRVILAPLDPTGIPLFVRGGYILPTQEPANSTMWSRHNPMGLIAALDDNEEAFGDLFWDDGETADSHLTTNNFHAEYDIYGRLLTGHVRRSGYAGANLLYIDNIRVMGVHEVILQVYINGEQLDNANWEHHILTRELDISNARIPLNSGFTVQW